MNVIEILQERANLHPDLPAIINTKHGNERVVTFAELEFASAKMAVHLQQSGLQAGDTALIFAPMSAELYIALGAVLRLGMIAMFLNPSAGRTHIEDCCRLHPPHAFIATTKAHLLRFISPAVRRIKKKFVLERLLQRVALPQSPTAIDSSQPAALITFTSGSTGEPKAALRTHEFLLAQHRVLQRTLDLQTGEIDLATLPIFVLANLASGMTSLIPQADLRFPGAINPAPIVRQIKKYQIHSTAASPAFLEKIADYCWQKNMCLTSWQKVFAGGAPVFPRLLEKLQRIAPNAEIVAVYGSTEAEPIAEIDYSQITARDNFLMRQGYGLLTGKPVPEIELRIVRDQWGSTISSLTQAEFEAMNLSNNEIGEIVVSGDHVLSGYLHGRGDQETKFSIAGKIWHRTGDAGYFDKAGQLWLMGRCAAKIIDARGTLYPFAVECAALAYPNVKRAALMEQQAKRCLILEKNDESEKIVIEEIEKKLRWAGLDEIRVIGKIPVDKRHNAKVDYPALKELIARG